MNQQLLLPLDLRSRRLFDAADLEQMIEAGIIGAEERLELVNGEILTMSPKTIEHEIAKQHLNLPPRA